MNMFGEGWNEWGFAGLHGIPETMALAAVALIGYLVGFRSRRVSPTSSTVCPKELHRAARIARQLEDTIDALRQGVAQHRTYVERFKTKVGEATTSEAQEVLALLSTEAENVIGPTLRLATQLAHAYDDLRRQSQALANFTEGRTDPLTGMGNAKSLEEQLELLLADRVGGGASASIALVSVDLPACAPPASDPYRDFVKGVAAEIEQCVRENDYIARLGGAEFAVLMTAARCRGADIRQSTPGKAAGRIGKGGLLRAGGSLAGGFPAVGALPGGFRPLQRPGSRARDAIHAHRPRNPGRRLPRVGAGRIDACLALR